MGHSRGFLDAQWLAGKILSWLFGGVPVPQGEFSLLGTREQIELVGLLTSGPPPRANIQRSQRPESAAGDIALQGTSVSPKDSSKPQEMCKSLTISFKKGMDKHPALSERLRTASPG